MDRIFPSLPADLQLLDVFHQFPHAVRPLLEYHDRVLRDESPLTVGERELIAAYVSALNACNFCHGAHAIAANVHGVPERLIQELIRNPEEAGVEPKLKPLLAYWRPYSAFDDGSGRLPPVSHRRPWAVGGTDPDASACRSHDHGFDRHLQLVVDQEHQTPSVA